MAVLLALGFSSGLPRLLVYSTLTFWLMDAGLSLSAVGVFAATSMPYSLKFLWAPVLDKLRLPGLGRLGQRRSWMLLTQLGCAAALAALSLIDPEVSLLMAAACCVVVATFSASQDVVVDAYRVDILTDEEQGAGAACAVFGYRIGMLVAGAGALGAAQWTGSWPLVYMGMAWCMGVGIVATLCARRVPELVVDVADHARSAWSKGVDALWGPMANLMKMRWWWLILIFVMCFKLGDSLAGTMLNPFLVQTGFSKLEIASVAKTYGVVASLFGVFVGGWAVRSMGVTRALWVAGFAQMFSNLVFVLQAYAGHNIWVLIATIGVENLCGGLGTAAFVAFLSQLCDRAYTATQYALLTALAGLLRTVLSSSTGWLAEQLGWMLYFGMTFVASIPGLILLAILMRLNSNMGEAKPKVPEAW